MAALVDLVRSVFTHRTGLAAAGVVTVAGAVFLAFVQLACTFNGVNPDVVFWDPAALFKAPFYTGVVSNLGIGVWGAAVAFGAFGWAAFRKGDDRQRELAAALGWFALLSLWLGMDDLVQVHEYIAPKLLGIRQKMVYLSYMILALAWTLRYVRIVLERAPLPLVVALAGMGASVAADIYGDWYTELPGVIEDGVKLIGLLNWAVWPAAIVWGEMQAMRRGLAASAAAAPKEPLVRGAIGA